MTGYYDIVLGLIPLALASISGTLWIAGVELTTAIPLASLVAVGLIGHAMFVRAPVDDLPTVEDHTDTGMTDTTQTAD